MFSTHFQHLEVFARAILLVMLKGGMESGVESNNILQSKMVYHISEHAFSQSPDAFCPHSHFFGTIFKNLA